MAVGKKKKAPITGAKSPSLSSKKTKAIINSFHQLLKKKKTTKDPKQLSDIDSEIENLGGMTAYQHASTVGQSSSRGGDSSHVFIAWLAELGVKREHLARKECEKMGLLEIGALVHNNYENERKWIDAELIDLKSNHPLIREQDFLQRPLPGKDDGKKDAISSSLVLNFVPTPVERGLFLIRLNTFLKHNGYLFMVLPAPCVTNSRYLTRDRFIEILNAVGFTLLREKIGDMKRGSRIAYWLLKKTAEPQKGREELSKKTVLVEGGNFNNFCILI